MTTLTNRRRIPNWQYIKRASITATMKTNGENDITTVHSTVAKLRLKTLQSYWSCDRSIHYNESINTMKIVQINGGSAENHNLENWTMWRPNTTMKNKDAHILLSMLKHQNPRKIKENESWNYSCFFRLHWIINERWNVAPRKNQMWKRPRSLMIDVWSMLCAN